MQEGASDRLELVKADLLEEGSFDDAVKDCTYVLHTASPFQIQAVGSQVPKPDAKRQLGRHTHIHTHTHTYTHIHTHTHTHIQASAHTCAHNVSLSSA